MSEHLETKTGWLSRDELENIRANVPLVYVDAVPVRVDELGRVTRVGMLLRQAADGSISRMAPTGNNWKFDAFATAEDAEKRRAQLEAMNPGSRFTVVAL